MTSPSNNTDWLPLCRRSDIPKRHGRRFILDDGREIALFDVDGTLRAVDNVCPHQRFPLLYEGEVVDGVVTCPMHSWRFDLATGACVSGNNARLKVYEVEEREGMVGVVRTVEDAPRWMS